MTHDRSRQQIQADISRVKEIAWGLVGTAAMVTAVRLRLAEAVGDGPRDAEEIARTTVGGADNPTLGADPTMLRQILDALVAREVFARDEDGRYRGTGLSALLREDDPNSMTYLVRWIGHPVFFELWPHLETAVREGKPQSVEVFGKDFFRYVHEDDPDHAVEVFNGAMTQASTHTSYEVVKSLDFTGVQAVADIGGGQGRLLRTMLEQHPEVRGTLLDLDGVVSKALPDLKAGGAYADRATLISGDCRREVPVQADLYVLKNILEWDDDSTVRTLENVRAAAGPGARVVVVETLTDHTPEPVVTTALDLLLLLNVGGRKHSSEHVRRLYEQTGIRFDRVRPTGTFLHLVEGTVTG